MIWTVFSTVLSGVTVYVLGQLVVKLVIEPVQETRNTIGQISHTLIEDGDAIHNAAFKSEVVSQERANEVSQHLRKLSAQLHSHLFLVPCYQETARIFRLPTRDGILAASEKLMWISNSFRSSMEDVHKQITTREESICNVLGIYFPKDRRWPKYD